MTSPSPTTASHRPVRRDIEGLRAVAVLTVLLYHLDVPWLPGGFAGVDVFFVISGFLITSLLLREVARTGRVSLVEFYARRARRLLPAASVVIAFTLAVGWFVLPGSERPNLLADVLGSTLYVVNWVLAARSVDYLAEDADVSPLQHYWSLSVEEQFYLVWPLLIILGLLLARRFRLRVRPTLFLLLTVLGLTSLVWSLVATRATPQTAYFVTTTRLWELAAGALLAFAVPRLGRLPRGVSQVAVVLGLGMIAYTVTVFDAGTPWPGSAALVPVLGSVLVIAAGAPGHRTMGGDFLGLAPMVWIGGLSYAIYLWHWPLVVLAEARWGQPSFLGLTVLGLLSILLAWLTKHLVEDPVRYQRSLARRPGLSLVTGSATMAAICAVALAGWVTRPALEDYTGTPGPAALVADGTAHDWQPLADPTVAYTETGPLEPPPALAPEDIPPYYADGCQIAQGDPDPREDCVYGQVGASTEVVLWGDSKIGQFFSPFDAIALAEGWQLTTYLKSACPPTLGGVGRQDCAAFGEDVVRRLVARETPPHLVLMTSGSIDDPDLIAGITEAVESLQRADIPVALVANTPFPGDEAYDCAEANPDDLRACDYVPDPQTWALMDAVAEQTGAPLIDAFPWMCPGTPTCPIAVGGQLVYRQGSHVTDTYARSLTPFLHRELSRLGYARIAIDEISLDDVPPRAGA